LMHPVWGFGFFVLVNRAVEAEQAWALKVRNFKRRIDPALMFRRAVGGLAFIGVFSYSLYLTHELVIMQSWWFVQKGLPPIVNALLIVVPATVGFAWLFFLFCEKPYMRKKEGGRQKAQGSRQKAESRMPEERGLARLPDPELFAVEFQNLD